MPVKERVKAQDAEKNKAKKKSKALRRRMPTKRAINLATVGQKKSRWELALPAMLLIVAAAFVFGKYAVADRFNAVLSLRGEVSQLQSQVNSGNARIEAYGELNDLYAHYTYLGMTAEELSLADRVAVMEMLERIVMPRMAVDSWALHGNQLSLMITGSTLEEINRTVQQLHGEDLVDYCNVTTARSSENGAADTDELVTASIVIYLKNAEREGQLK